MQSTHVPSYIGAAVALLPFRFFCPTTNGVYYILKTYTYFIYEDYACTRITKMKSNQK
jgi:hypothetical protein